MNRRTTSLVTSEANVTFVKLKGVKGPPAGGVGTLGHHKSPPAEKRSARAPAVLKPLPEQQPLDAETRKQALREFAQKKAPGGAKVLLLSGGQRQHHGYREQALYLSGALENTGRYEVTCCS